MSGLHAIKSVLFLLLFLPCLLWADDSPTKEDKDDESFQSICLASWMKRVDATTDQAQYKNFGEKYCGCALTQSLDTDAAVDKAIKVCISRTLLQEAMDSMEEKVGFAKATDQDINQFCLNKWALIYPKMNDEAKQTATAFCNCSQPKLVELVKGAENLTDKDFASRLNPIADACAETIKPVSPTTSKDN